MFKSSVGKAFINKLKECQRMKMKYMYKTSTRTKVRYKQEEKGQDRVIIPIIAEGKKNLI